ncbi:MAG: hypothetical protein ACXIT4_06535 [Erythrobacter sp.]
MIRKILGAALGAKIVKNAPALGGAAGAAVAVAVPAVVARIGLPAMVLLGAGGYLYKRYRDKRDEAGPSADTSVPVTSSAAVSDGAAVPESGSDPLA